MSYIAKISIKKQKFFKNFFDTKKPLFSPRTAKSTALFFIPRALMRFQPLA